MAKIIPFKGILYNPARVSGDDVVAPPYDIISPEHKETLYQKSPYNIVRVDFGKELPDDSEAGNKYTRARAYLQEWIEEQILVQDEHPSLYAYEIEYRTDCNATPHPHPLPCLPDRQAQGAREKNRRPLPQGEREKSGRPLSQRERERQEVERVEREKTLSLRGDDPLFSSPPLRGGDEGEGERKVLRGFFTLVKIEELGKGVYPHEATHAKPKADRLNLMRSCAANISPIYALYNSPERAASHILEALSNPYLTAHDADGAVHKLYKISSRDQIAVIQQELSDKPLFIADGHHRYEVALEYKKEMDQLHEDSCKGEKCGEHPWDYVLMFLANMSDEGIAVLPTHRMVKGTPPKEELLTRLQPHFAIENQGEVTSSAVILNTLKAGGRNVFGLYFDQDREWYLLKYKGVDLKDIHPALKDLDVVVLQELILKRDLEISDIAYEMDISEAISMVQRAQYDAVFFLNATNVSDVERVALSQLRMPPKSTYFYPKLLTGMVINKFTVNE